MRPMLYFFCNMRKVFNIITSEDIGMRKLLYTLPIAILIVNSGCSSQPVRPDQIQVETSREAPDPDCQPLGKVVGRTSTAKGSIGQAIEDLKKETISSGGNYVQIKKYSDTRTAVTGLAFWCP